jgi:hypothetical protein
MMANQLVVHVLKLQRQVQERQLRVQPVPRSRMALLKVLLLLLRRLRKQENNHAATSTQKIS